MTIVEVVHFDIRDDDDDASVSDDDEVCSHCTDLPGRWLHEDLPSVLACDGGIGSEVDEPEREPM